MNTKLKRISKELDNLHKEPIKYIYIDYDDSKIDHLEILFIGPRFTPYSRMFMRFTIQFPDMYPIQPPKVIFTSSYDRKIHPNIFPGGWLCLSTLNVGDSSGWVPTISLSSLLVTLYSMFSKEMIQIDNTHTHDKSPDYFPAVMFDCFYITAKLLQDEPNLKFKEIITSYVKKHSDWYIRKLNKLSLEYDGKCLKNYYLNEVADFKSLIESFKK